MHLLRLVSAALAAASLAAAAQAAQLTVFAAASLSDALGEIAPIYARATGDTVRFNFGGSGALALQIREGAPADVFVSADELRVDNLEKAGLILPGTRRTILANQLVLVVSAEDGAPVRAPADLAGTVIRRIAIGEPATVPAGAYARAYLGKLGLWDRLSGKTVPLANVRAVLSAVVAGDADAGFVYRTDALVSSKVIVAFAVPVPEGPRITYPVAVLRDAREKARAMAFAAFLSGPESRAVFAKCGFLLPN